ncbi:MAG: CusA/CzcA family heavy metal efflux RND transporter [Candidatus Azobacteroides sp.]|nr:CusA/CzcA family heavy metal efflux RND transporter [Candidatus Azobacteroides sp.]
MLGKIIRFSLKNKLIILLFTLGILGYGIFSVFRVSIGAVPDITNNQIQVITTSTNLSTQDIEQFITYPVEMEMANLPGVQEIRSISKFGLSVVTIVFDDNLGTYLPRQLVAEKLVTAVEQIPEGFGAPVMGPISTGLGEIYQYTLEVKPEFKNRYTLTDLRTIQDWIVKRQLSGIPGVVEINTWGGYLKQYEVAIVPAVLNAMNISVYELLTALEKNNSIAGGAYIEKTNQSYFIRGEGKINSIADIENIVVKSGKSIPVLVKDVATVHIGHAVRFGAITGNGEGEKILGQIMMLKGADSRQVIKDVKARVEQVQKTLPEGVYINPFLERSELVAKTTTTVAENLIIGFLIVIFVVVLLLGNFRSGLVVASLIPLCLLFTISLMTLFGIDANLMSLGAIDFGIIIDGAVIIVEYVSFRISSNFALLQSLDKRQRQEAIDTITNESASKMMNSAAFGQLIILIVFIPILSLVGVEGKMFRPMALTFSFAVIGAMILCFTYVPVVSSLLLRPHKENPKSLSSFFIRLLHTTYYPVIRWALKNTKKIVVLSVLLVALAVWTYNRMGGEFIPQLDEGDFVIQPVLKTGTTLTQTIETTTKIEQILLKQFPEVTQVVSRIGAAEVPTDPMSMEETDIIIRLKPKNEWVSAKTKAELAEKIKEALAVFPNTDIEFTQPIEMRFNELISGSRSNVAIKIFGEDLDILSQKAQEIKKAIANVKGASDIIIEKVEGLPQMMVRYDRAKIAQYGLQIAELNDLITLGFAGKTTGNVFEGEKRFDIVLRFDTAARNDIEHLRNLYVPLPSGGQVPLREVADIHYAEGPAKISRDNTQRRIIVGVNVRNRDMQSVVNDIEKIVNQKISLPPGYIITYGGQFENLQSATKRLKIAVPIALCLIFILLYFAFTSMRETVMVFSAIPLAAVGGIFSLWIRGLPFSISAGVGFIALFGIAVLNGIVLIEHFKDLRKDNKKDRNMDALIIQGAIDRLRPVALTAGAAALGFLPMAVSTHAGAEVQRPLATVVIGGLITSTFLTMVVLPVLFKIVEGKERIFSKKSKVGKGIALLIGIMLFAAHPLSAQNPELDNLIQTAFDNNKGIRSLQIQTQQQKANINAAFTFDKTSVYYSYDENNIAPNNLPLRVWGIEQNFLFPTVYTSQYKVNKAEWKISQTAYEIARNKLALEVSLVYEQIVWIQQREKLYQYLDSLYSDFARAGSRKFELGETNYLEKITAEAKSKRIHTSLTKVVREKRAAYEQLAALLQVNDTIVVTNNETKELNIPANNTVQNLHRDNLENTAALYKSRLNLERNNWLPNINLEYFQGTNSAMKGSMYGFQIGLSFPLLFTGNLSKNKTAKLGLLQWEEQRKNQEAKMNGFLAVKQSELEQKHEAIRYYNESGKRLSDEIIHTAEKSYRNGEIDFFQYIQSMENAADIQLDYLNNLLQYNQVYLELYYFNYNE